MAEIRRAYQQQAGQVASTTAEVQVVAGLNYRFHVEMSGQTPATYTVSVFRDLQGNMSVTQIDRAGAPH